MNTYKRDRKHYTMTVEQKDGRFYAIITDNSNGNTWTSAPYAYRDSALRAGQNKYNKLNS